MLGPAAALSFSLLFGFVGAGWVASVATILLDAGRGTCTAEGLSSFPECLIVVGVGRPRVFILGAGALGGSELPSKFWAWERVTRVVWTVSTGCLRFLTSTLVVTCVAGGLEACGSTGCAGSFVLVLRINCVAGGLPTRHERSSCGGIITSRGIPLCIRGNLESWMEGLFKSRCLADSIDCLADSADPVSEFLLQSVTM